MTRSKMALRFSARALFALTGRPYFWTFTLRECVDVKTAMQSWNKLQKSLHHWGLHPKTGEQTIFGVRAFELHPGGHGVHVHVLLNRYLHVHVMRKRCEQFGFGWIHVVRIRNSGQANEIADYMSKYMNKQDRPECFKGCRLWAAIGKWGASKCSDIEIESEFNCAFYARRSLVNAEAKIAALEGRKYRVEHNLETMEWAKQHLFEVKIGKRESLSGLIWDVSEPSEVAKSWDDWDGLFDLVPARQQGPGAAFAG